MLGYALALQKQRRAGRQSADGALHRANIVCQGTLDS